MKKRTKLGIFAAAVAGVLTLGLHTQPVYAEAQDTIEDGIYIGNVDVGGMDESQAKSAVKDYVASLMDTTFTLQGETGSIQMTAADMGVTADTDAAVEEAMAVGHAGSLINRYKTLADLKNDKLVLDMHLSVDKQSTAEKIYASADDLAVGAVDNSLKRVNGKFEFVKGKEGVEVDVVNSVYAINDFLAEGWDGTDNEIDLVTKTVEPRGDEEELAEVTDLLGSFNTNFASSSAGRAKNVTTGVSKVDGTILYPGEEFDLAKTVSPFTQENGYELAGSYQNGAVVESFGGGICQVSTTLYNAAIRAELEITMRYNHSMLVHYVEPSMDAAIAGNYKDLKFKNNLDTPVYIEGYCSGGVIYFNIYGKETRPSNREISFESETVSKIEPKAQFTLSSSLAAGTVAVTQSGQSGCIAQMWKIVTVDGKQQSRELFNKSSYQATPKLITIGTRDATSESLAALKAAVATGDEAKVRSAAAALKTNAAQKAEEEKDKEEEEETQDEEEEEKDTEEKDDKDDSSKKEDTSKKDDTSTKKDDSKKDDTSTKKDDTSKKEDTSTKKDDTSKKEDTSTKKDNTSSTTTKKEETVKEKE